VGLAVPLDDDSPVKVWPAVAFPAGTPAPLIIGSVGDTATPYVWSEALNSFFNDNNIGSVLLTYEGAEHVAGFGWPPPPCISGPIISLFAGDGLPDPDIACPYVSTLNRQPPVGVRAEAGAGQATLGWAVSEQRLGGTVEGFGVEQRQVPDGDWERVDESGGSCDTTFDEPDTTSCVVGGLTGGVTYEFRMTTLPLSFYEDEPLFSAVSNEVTPTPPLPPAPAVVPSVGEVEVTAPDATGLDVEPLRWVVTANPGGTSCDIDAPTGSCVIDGLDETGTYTFTAVGFNGEDQTPVSLPSQQVTPGAGSAVPQFVDVPEDSYFVRATSMLKQRGITTGTNPAEDEYSPQRQVNRQQMAALLWRMAGEPDAPESCGFVDEDQIATFARQATCWLLAQNITDNNPYRPLADVNRQQMAAFLWRFAGEPDAPDTCGIDDQDSIAVWARQAVCWMTDTAITTNNPYEPLNVVNRAQMAAFLYRLGGQQNLWVSLATGTPATPA
jgi:hypothetical protein